MEKAVAMQSDDALLDERLLEVCDVSTQFAARRRSGSHKATIAVDRVSLTINKGETLGLVGESGCGKSTLARSIMGILPLAQGAIRFGGLDVGDHRSRTTLRREMQMIFQDPWESLNPNRRIGAIVADGLAIHRIGTRDERRHRVASALERVGLPIDAAKRFPHEFSGGQRQRIGIARALVLSPRLIVADEPVSALDVSVQAQVLNLMHDLREQLGLTYLFISHDIAVVSHISDRIAVMYLGRIMEEADSETLLETPLHPYTVTLLSSIPRRRGSPAEAWPARIRLNGELPSARDRPSGCVFRTRCPIAQNICSTSEPQLTMHRGHKVACHFPGDLTTVEAVDISSAER
jgi:oligopeptide/dipeptide ABC transporter ATP-binding protein